MKMCCLGSEKIPIFPEAVVLVKNLKIFPTFFLGKKSLEILFPDIVDRKNGFPCNKNLFLK